MKKNIYAKNWKSGTIQVMIDDINSNPLATLTTPLTGSWTTFQTTTVTFNGINVKGVHKVFLKFMSGFNFDWFSFS